MSRRKAAQNSKAFSKRKNNGAGVTPPLDQGEI